MYGKHVFFVAALGVVLLLPRNLVFSQNSAAHQDKAAGAGGNLVQSDDDQAPIDEDIKLFRKNLQSERKQIVAANMNLTDAEAQKFWPVYDQYTADLAKFNDTKAALIKNYLQTVDTMSGEQAMSYVQKRADIEESIMQLRLKYIPAFRKVLSDRHTALFYQIDWRISLITDLQLAQAPMIDPNPN